MNNLKPPYGGLINLGNTCYLNSCVQILNYTYELDILFSLNIKPYIKTNEQSIVLEEWKDLKDNMSRHILISPNKFVASVFKICNENSNIHLGWNQNDITEFFLFMMDCFHKSISRKIQTNINGTAENATDELALKCFHLLKCMYESEYSEILDLFYGISVSFITSINNSINHSIVPENYFILNLSLPLNNDENLSFSLYDCFDLFVKKELLENDNAWFNDKTGVKENVFKYTQFWNFPKILIITLNRFMNNTKVNNLIHFPLENLNLSKYVVGYNSMTFIYDLYAVGNHYGNLNMGHYTSTVKDKYGNWYNYNDNLIEKIENFTQIVNSNAYCLFYRIHSS
jgi:ubiquitin carboxyl-terminal hydrolase 8